MVCRRLSPLTWGASSPWPSGTASATSWASGMCRPPPTTRSPTAWWSASTGASRMPCGPTWPAPRGQRTSPGFFLGCVPPHVRRTTSLPLSLFLAHPLFCQVNFWTKKQMLMNRNFYKIFLKLWVLPKSFLPGTTWHEPIRPLRICLPVLVCCNGHVPPLAPLYDGPYCVLTRSHDFFWLQIGDRTDTVSTSRLKPSMDPSATPVARCDMDVPRDSGRMSPSVGRPWRPRWPDWPRRRCPLLHLLCLLELWPLLGCHHHLCRGPEPFFPTARSFLYARTPARNSGPPHRPASRNASDGC
jgi:hypothetical protein